MSREICEVLVINHNVIFVIFTKSFGEAKNIIEKFGDNWDIVDDYCSFGDIMVLSTLTVSKNSHLCVLSGQRIIINKKSSNILLKEEMLSIY